MVKLQTVVPRGVRWRHVAVRSDDKAPHRKSSGAITLEDQEGICEDTTECEIRRKRHKAEIRIIRHSLKENKTAPNQLL